MFVWLRSRAGRLWLTDVGERTGWTFAEVFAAVFGLQGLDALASGHLPLGIAKGAALAGLAAAFAIVKGAVVAKVKGGGLSPASTASTPDPEPPPGTDPGWDAPAPEDATRPPVPRSSTFADLIGDDGPLLLAPDAGVRAEIDAAGVHVSDAGGNTVADVSSGTGKVAVTGSVGQKRRQTPAQSAARARRAAREAAEKKATRKKAVKKKPAARKKATTRRTRT